MNDVLSVEKVRTALRECELHLKLGVIAAKSDWLELRALRNQLTHEYEDNAESMSAVINQVYASFGRIEQLYRQAADFIRPYL